MITYKVTIDVNKDRHWYVNGKLHREDGPAIECANGDKSWYRNGQLHREDGPAIEYDNGNKAWFLNGIELTEVEFNKRMKKKNTTCEGKMVEIDGVKYKLTKV